jgi:hypothetical protein
MADPREINYHNGEKLYNKEKVDELLATKQDVITPDTTVQANDHLVENQAVKAYVDAETQRAEATEGDLDDLVTTDKSNLVAAINEVKESAYTVDEHVTAGSTNPVESAGIKEYVDDQDAATLQTAKDYTDGRIGEFHPEDGSTVVELTGHLDDLDNAAESLVAAINAEGNRITAVENGVSDLDGRLATERQKRIEGDQRLADMINSVDQTKQDKLTFDDTPTHGSDNPVKSTGIKDYVDEITGQLEDLETPAESLVSAINALDERFTPPDTEMSDDSENAVQNKVIKAYVDDKDTTPTEDSEKAVTSDGIYKAIKKAGVKIGEIMDWPQFQIETRTMVSDNPFEFTFAGQTHSVAVEPKDVELEIADNVPEGWAAMSGTAVLDAATNQELADFFGGRNTTTDGKIWIPYLPRKIIKVAY